MKAIALLSGGLDSTLAAKIVLDLGIELEALNFLTVFCTCTNKGETCLASQKAVSALGIPLKVLNVSEAYLPVVKNPKHGYGSNMNPCIDCRIFMLKKAKAYMEEIGASFIVTGEVLGERPMSQRRDSMRLIEKEAGLDGLILRPLSAKLLPASIPEKEDWVDREKLLKIQGRSRKPQIHLADHYGIRDYPCPAGGCLLTDPVFPLRLMMSIC
jgi:tRNA U34 2-thiouridine synthase MnmA/TrmU